MSIKEILKSLEEFTETNVDVSKTSRIEIPYINAVKLVDYIYHLEECKRILDLILEDKE